MSRDAVAADGRTAWLIAAFTDHAANVHTLARRMVGDHQRAQDVVQATFIQGWQHCEQLRDASSTRSWLLRIAYRESLHALRDRREVPTAPEDLTDARAADDPAAEVVARDERDRVLALLLTLPESLRAAVLLRDVNDLPMAEVATVLGVSASAAKMRVHRGREALRCAWNEQEVNHGL
jgi:RNA polymerase sigma-70 factor (ECF subfamily)